MTFSWQKLPQQPANSLASWSYMMQVSPVMVSLQGKIAFICLQCTWASIEPARA